MVPRPLVRARRAAGLRLADQVDEQGIFEELVDGVEEVVVGLPPEERDRYVTATHRRYAAALDRRFVREERLDALIAGLRLFYRLGWREKLDRIATIRRAA